MTDSLDKDADPARQRGNRLGFHIFVFALRWTGLRGAYGLVWLVCAHYLLFDRAAVRVAHAYVRRRFASHSRFRQWLAIYRLFVEQGKNLIDRHCLLHRAQDFEIEFEGQPELDEVMASSGGGFVLLMSHMGNWQTILTTLRHLNRPVHLLMRPEDNPAVQKSLRVDENAGPARVISPDGFMGGVIEMMARLKAGEIVSIMGDRSYGAATESAPFLGEPARFPVAAWRLAAGAECPIAVLFPAKVSARRYKIRLAKVFRPRFELGADRRTQMQNWIRDYAALLDQYASEYPFQCFLFRDIWKEEKPEQ